MKRFGLSSNERIKSRKDFEIVYSSGKTIFSFDNRIKLIYFIEKIDNKGGIKVAVVVSKKVGSAVWRNRVKRILKNSFRLNKNEVAEHCRKNKLLLKAVFSTNRLNENRNKMVDEIDLLPGIIDVLKKIMNAIE